MELSTVMNPTLQQSQVPYFWHDFSLPGGTLRQRSSLDCFFCCSLNVEEKKMFAKSVNKWGSVEQY